MNEREDIRYNQTFSTDTKLGAVRSLISIAASEKMPLMHFEFGPNFPTVI